RRFGRDAPAPPPSPLPCRDGRSASRRLRRCAQRRPDGPSWRPTPEDGRSERPPLGPRSTPARILLPSLTPCPEPSAIAGALPERNRPAEPLWGDRSAHLGFASPTKGGFLCRRGG